MNIRGYVILTRHTYVYITHMHTLKVYTTCIPTRRVDRSDLREPKTKVDERGRESHDLSGRRLVREISSSSEFPMSFREKSDEVGG